MISDACQWPVAQYWPFAFISLKLWFNLGLEPGLGLDSNGLGFELGKCWTLYKSGSRSSSGGGVSE